MKFLRDCTGSVTMLVDVRISVPSKDDLSIDSDQTGLFDFCKSIWPWQRENWTLDILLRLLFTSYRKIIQECGLLKGDKNKNHVKM